jgi:mono/diheme cytochrome c family protein
MRILVITILASLPLLAQPTGSAKNGRKLFENFGCYQCHGREAQGGLGTGPRLGPKPIAFSALQRYVRQPTGQMPPYTAKVVSDQDLADIYAFLQAVKQPPAVKDIPLLNK